MKPMINVELECANENCMPEYKTNGSSGVDLKANIDDDYITIEPFERVLVPTGIKIALPAGYEAQVRPRSGMALKQGITVLNTPGTVDADYRGEVGAILINLSNERVTIRKFDRIAQLVFQKVEQAQFTVVQAICNDTDRGAGGFGHTGKN